MRKIEQHKIYKSGEALDKLLSLDSWKSVLDIGCGKGEHSDRFRAAGKEVTPIDYVAVYDGCLAVDYLQHDFAQPFDCIWMSHVLEHQVQANLFLKKVFRELKAGGILAVTVPPLKPNIVGGHVNLWNGGLLLYNLILAGFDCSQAQLKAYGYNISVITPKIAAPIEQIDLHFCDGDIEKLAPYFPKVPGMKWEQAFDGEIRQINWDRPGIDFQKDAGNWRQWLKNIFSLRYWFPKEAAATAKVT